MRSIAFTCDFIYTFRRGEICLASPYRFPDPVFTFIPIITFCSAHYIPYLPSSLLSIPLCLDAITISGYTIGGLLVVIIDIIVVSAGLFVGAVVGLLLLFTVSIMLDCFGVVLFCLLIIVIPLCFLMV